MQQRITVAFFALLLVVTGLSGSASSVMAQGRDASEIASASSDAKVKKSPPPNVAGSWCGSVKDNDAGSGEINLSIKQSGKQLSGTWSDDFGGSGTLSGKINGTAVSAKLKDQANKCKLQVNGTLVSPGEITGNYSQFGCHEADGGSFDITSPSC
jgi:hypothetical protein